MSKNSPYKYSLDVSTNIGVVLKQIRKKQKVSLDFVSKNTGIASETIRRIEANMFEPKISTLEILSQFYQVDLIELISKKRIKYSIFSDELIRETNIFINAQNFIGLKKHIESLLAEIQLSEIQIPNSLTIYLNCLKYLKYNPQNGQKEIIVQLESALLSISPYYLHENGTTYPFPLEISIILFLSVLYRQNNMYEKAIQILTISIKRVNSLPFINDRFSSYLAAMYINLANTYHSMKKHEDVVTTVNKGLENTQISFNKLSLSQLLFRKGLSLHLLGDPSSQSFLNVSLSLMDQKTQNLMQEILKRDYNIF